MLLLLQKRFRGLQYLSLGKTSKRNEFHNGSISKRLHRIGILDYERNFYLHGSHLLISTVQESRLCHKLSVSPNSSLKTGSSNQIGIIAFRHSIPKMPVSSNNEQQPDKPGHSTQQVSRNLPSHST